MTFPVYRAVNLFGNVQEVVFDHPDHLKACLG
jgi:hypothetical protein